MAKPSAARKGKRGAKKVSLKNPWKIKGKMQFIKKLKCNTHQKTIKKEKVSMRKQKKNNLKKPNGNQSRYLPSANEMQSDDYKASVYKEWCMEFHECIARAKAAEEACTNNPDDTENLKKWAFALVDTLDTTREYTIDAVEFLQVAQSNLEHVLKIDPNDHDAIFYLGLVHYYFMRHDHKITYRDKDIYWYHCFEAIECFKVFQDDQIFQAPKGHDVSELWCAMEYYLVHIMRYPEDMGDYDTKTNDTDDSDMDDCDMEADNEITHEEHLWDELRVAKIANLENPKNVESLRRWAHAMIGLSYCTMNLKKRQVFYKEAIAKLELAFEINKDKKLKLELLKARLEFGDNEEKEKDTLAKEYIKLYKELNLHLDEGNSSTWTLTACQRNKKVVSLEDDENSEVGFDPDEYRYLYEELKLHHNDSESVELQDPSRVSKTVFVANLPYSVKQADIEDFFKDAGKVVGVRFSSNAAGVLKGYGDVEFDTPEAVHKAVELNDEQLMGRHLRIEIVNANIRGPYPWGRDSLIDRKAGTFGKSGFCIKDLPKAKKIYFDDE